MKKTASFLVEKRLILFILFLALAAVSLALATQVKTNYDLAEYLPDDSRMKQGMRIMEQAFGPTAASDLRVMLTGLTEEEQAEVQSWFEG